MAANPEAPPVGLGWQMPATAPPTWATGKGGWIRQLTAEALGTGIRTFHLGVDPSTLARLPLILAEIHEAHTPVDVVLVVGPPPPSSPRSGDGRSSLPLAPTPKVRWHVELPSALLDRPEGSVWTEELEAARHHDRIRSWGVGVTTLSPGSVQQIKASAVTPMWVRAPYHLLSDRGATEALETLAADGVAVVASDPFASGRLDGRFLAESYLDSPVNSRIHDVERLKREWAPVLRLGFLTRSDRPLPAASLAFLRDRPGISAVLVEARDAGELRRASEAWSGPPLSPDERRRVEQLRE